MKNVARLIELNARDRKSSSGTSGLGRRAIRIGNRTSETTPTTIAIQAAVSAHSLAWPRMTPNARPPTASAATSAPSQSNRPVVSVSRDSWTWVSVAHRANPSSGTLIRNATRQPSVSTRPPPTIGPTTDKAAVEAAQIPNARPSSGPVKACVISASEPGTRSAPAAPCRSLKTTSDSSVGASPHSADVAANPIRPIAKTRRRP